MNNEQLIVGLRMIPQACFYPLISKPSCGIMRRRVTRGEFETFLT